MSEHFVKCWIPYWDAIERGTRTSMFAVEPGYVVLALIPADGQSK